MALSRQGFHLLSSPRSAPHDNWSAISPISLVTSELSTSSTSDNQPLISRRKRPKVKKIRIKLRDSELMLLKLGFEDKEINVVYKGMRMGNIEGVASQFSEIEGSICKRIQVHDCGRD